MHATWKLLDEWSEGFPRARKPSRGDTVRIASSCLLVVAAATTRWLLPSVITGLPCGAALVRLAMAGWYRLHER
jgi:enoyl-CoA hydratase/carnithine racemase